MNKEELVRGLKELRRKGTEENPGPSVMAAIDLLISCCEFLLNSSAEKEKT